MSKIIYSTNNGLITQGFIDSQEPLFKTKIFLDDPENFLGFRTSLKQHTEPVEGVVTDYYEIGYFMEMLYEGKFEAFHILKMPTEHVDFQLYDFDILKKEEEKLISLNLIKNLKEQAAVSFKGLDDPENFKTKILDKSDENSMKYFAEIFGFNNKNAYICLRNLIIAENVLKYGKFELKDTHTALLQGVIDGKFSLKAITEGYHMYLKSVDELLENDVLRKTPDFKTMNTILADIRNIDIIQKNIERI